MLTVVVVSLLPCIASAIDLRLGLEWFLNPDHLPLIVALREGETAPGP